MRWEIAPKIRAHIVGFTGIKAMYPPYTPKVRKLISWLVKYL